jgi:hypothetical protein
MTQQYGFRTTSNLSEVLDRNICLDNLGIDRRDLALLVGTSDSGVVESDYQAIIGLSSNLEQQIVTLSSGATVSLSGISARASRFGDTFTGAIFADVVNNDRPYTTQSGVIIGPSTVSYFSPSASGLFSSGGEYKLGPVTAATIQSSGINYTGTLAQWESRFIRYKNFLQVQEQPSWTVRRVPLFLPPPTAISGCVMWLDAEYSEVDLDGSNGVIQWKGVGSGPVATQTIFARRPIYTTNVMNGKPAIRFDGSNESLNLGNLGYLAPSAATIVMKVRVSDGNYSIFSTLNNAACRWNDGGQNIDLGVFTTAIQTNMAPGQAESNGTFTFAVRASAAYGLEIRKNSVRLDYKSTGFAYTGGDTYILGSAPSNSGSMDGDIHSFAFFNRVLSDKELRTVEEYFAWRYDAVYDPDRTQALQLENFATIDLEDDTPMVLG